MKLHGRYMKTCVFLLFFVFLFSYRQYMFQVSLDLASSSRELWNDYAGNSGGKSHVRSPVIAKRADVLPEAPPKGDGRSALRETMKEIPSNSIFKKPKEAINAVLNKTKHVFARVLNRRNNLAEQINKKIDALEEERKKKKVTPSYKQKPKKKDMQQKVPNSRDHQRISKDDKKGKGAKVATIKRKNKLHAVFNKKKATVAKVHEKKKAKILRKHTPKRKVVAHRVPSRRGGKFDRKDLKRKIGSKTMSVKRKHSVNAVLNKRKVVLAKARVKRIQNFVKLQKMKRGTVVHNNIKLPITILKQNTKLCRKSSRLKWIFYVHSAAEHFAQRHIIRQTWGNKDLFKDRRTAIVFIIGKSQVLGVQQRLDSEFHEFGDLVQGDFIDSYQTMAQKAVLGFQYISKHCSHIPYAVKSDDDVVIDIFRLMNTVKSVKHRNFVMCFHLENKQILRTNRKMGKARRWGIPRDVLLNQKVYPPHCAGLGYVITTRLLPQMLKNVMYVPNIERDDIYTGILMNKLPRVNYINLARRFSYDSWSGRQAYFAPDRKPFFMFTVYPGDTRILWTKVLKYLDNDMRKLLNPTVINLRRRGRN